MTFKKDEIRVTNIMTGEIVESPNVDFLLDSFKRLGWLVTDKYEVLIMMGINKHDTIDLETGYLTYEEVNDMLNTIKENQKELA